MNKNNKKRITLGILLGTIGIFGVGLYLRERGKLERKITEKEENKEERVREDTEAENTNRSMRKLCISILNDEENRPTSPADFMRALVCQGMHGGDVILKRIPKTIGEMEDMLADFKIYREYSRVCYSKLGKVEKKPGGAVILGKI